MEMIILFGGFEIFHMKARIAVRWVLFFLILGSGFQNAVDRVWDWATLIECFASEGEHARAGGEGGEGYGSMIGYTPGLEATRKEVREKPWEYIPNGLDDKQRRCD